MWLLSWIEDGLSKNLLFHDPDDLVKYAMMFNQAQFTFSKVQVYTKPQKAEGKKDPSQGLPEPLSR